MIRSFYIPKLENAKVCPLIWNCDESIAVRQFIKEDKTSVLEVYDAKLTEKICDLRETRALVT